SHRPDALPPLVERVRPVRRGLNRQEFYLNMPALGMNARRLREIRFDLYGYRRGRIDYSNFRSIALRSSNERPVPKLYPLPRRAQGDVRRLGTPTASGSARRNQPGSIGVQPAEW